jgi:DNA-binding XRE family transcriptional regulator
VELLEKGLRTCLPAVYRPRRPRPQIIRFLGYKPLPEGKTWGERLVRHRKSPGITQAEAARRIGVDQGTLAKWERGERQPKDLAASVGEERGYERE